jgi:hypothetical protein
MKFIFFALFLFNSALSQRLEKCFENIKINENENNFNIFVNDRKLKFDKPSELRNEINKIYLNKTSNCLILSYGYNNGIENIDVYNIFECEKNNLFLKNILKRYDSRYKTTYSIAKISNLNIDEFKIEIDSFNNKYNEKQISYISGYQEGKEVQDIDYYKLIKETFNNKKYDEIKMYTNEFVIQELGIENLNINDFNNIAYYAYKSKAYEESIYILTKIIQKFPRRVVAYLNIADCYWEIKEKEKAIINYKKYIQLMKEQKKDLKKIPKYVYDRIR